MAIWSVIIWIESSVTPLLAVTISDHLLSNFSGVDQVELFLTEFLLLRLQLLSLYTVLFKTSLVDCGALCQPL